MAQRPIKQTGMDIPEFIEETELALERNGAKIIFTTDDWFAEANNLLSHKEPIFLPEEFTTYGKWMDGWETRRKRIPGHDWCVIELGLPGYIMGFDVDTSFFTGNNTPRCSILGACIDPKNPDLEILKDKREKAGLRIGTASTPEDIAEVSSICDTIQWDTLVEMSPLGPGYIDTCHNFFSITNPSFLAKRYTHIRLNMFPDGGIARLRVYGRVSIKYAGLNSNQNESKSLIDLVAVENGGRAIGCSDKHYGDAKNLINPGRGINMGDGWETARKVTRPSILEADEENPSLLKVPGSDYVILQLGTIGKIEKIEVDTCWFKGNFPESCNIEGCGPISAPIENGSSSKSISGGSGGLIRNQVIMDMEKEGKIQWRPILPRTKLNADYQHYYSRERDEGQGVLVEDHEPIQYIKLTQYPDGGISRLRLWGYPFISANL